MPYTAEQFGKFVLLRRQPERRLETLACGVATPSLITYGRYPLTEVHHLGESRRTLVGRGTLGCPTVAQASVAPGEQTEGTELRRDLQELLNSVWRSLESATARRTPFTLGHLGTVGPAGAPRVRAIILRHFEQDRASVLFATNTGAAKIAEMRENPLVALTVNDDDAAVQLRMEGRAEIIEDPNLRRLAWESFGPQTRHLYQSPSVPGTPLSELQTPEPVEVESAGGCENTEFDRFACVRINLETLDWLDISSPEHQRCQFVRVGHGWTGQRVVP
ncbi:pyridoxamine 5'-phosphate oxidase family protein [Nocardioides sp. NPDC058538]|uniref:pyridoxamine 5'-phosphate oxidase family protein n=1 Tax=Nocardioides sp. NPDC058538 TaxID=3346542 RepID=UPI0036657231